MFLEESSNIDNVENKLYLGFELMNRLGIYYVILLGSWESFFFEWVYYSNVKINFDFIGC